MMPLRRLVALIACGATIATAWPQDRAEQSAERHLQCEFSDAPLRGIRPGLELPRIGDLRPTHLALFVTDPPSSVDIKKEDMLKMPAAAKLSEAQRILMQDPKWVLGHTMYGAIVLPELANVTCYDLYAVSQEDACRVAEAAVEAMEVDRQSHIGDLEYLITAYRGQLVDQEQKIAALEDEINRVRAENDGLPTYDSDAQIAESVRELEKMRMGIDVDIAGIRARTQAIDEIRRRAGSGDAGAVAVLDRLQIEQDVELAGALARRSAVDVRRRLAEASHQLLSLKSRLSKIESSITSGERDLDAARGLPPVRVRDDRILIRPLV